MNNNSNGDFDFSDDTSMFDEDMVLVDAAHRAAMRQIMAVPAEVLAAAMAVDPSSPD